MDRASGCSTCGRVFGCLILIFSNLGLAAEPGADEPATIRLLSNESADVCIKDQDCMRRLFVRATLGEGSVSDGASRRLFKWNGPVHIASFIGSQTANDAQAAVGHALQQIRQIALIAGQELSLIEEDTGKVVNLVLLVSGNFARDRHTVFSGLLSDVFAGRSELYDKLTSGSSPVCQSQLFVDRDGSISGALALVESDVDAVAFHRCLQRVVLKVLGLRHPLPDDVDSILSPNSHRQAWTSIDFMLLKMLSDPALVPGMELNELISIFPKIHRKALHPNS